MTYFWCCDVSQCTEKLLGTKETFKKRVLYCVSVLNVVLCVVFRDKGYWKLNQHRREREKEMREYWSNRIRQKEANGKSQKMLEETENLGKKEGELRKSVLTDRGDRNSPFHQASSTAHIQIWFPWQEPPKAGREAWMGETWTSTKQQSLWTMGLAKGKVNNPNQKENSPLGSQNYWSKGQTVLLQVPPDSCF